METFCQAVQKAVAQLKGAYAVALVHRDYPDQIIAIAHEAPLVIGIGDHEAFISSDPHAFAFYTRQAIYLPIPKLLLSKPRASRFILLMCRSIKKRIFSDNEFSDASKGDYEHYTLKEIFEQPQTLRNALLSRFLLEYGTAFFEELKFDDAEFLQLKEY